MKTTYSPGNSPHFENATFEINYMISKISYVELLSSDFLSNFGPIFVPFNEANYKYHPTMDDFHLSNGWLALSIIVFCLDADYDRKT